MNNKSAVIIALLFLAGCSNNQQTAGGFRVKGRIQHFTGKVITLNELTPKGLIFLDTAEVAGDGSFELNGNVPEKTFCSISFPKGAVILLLDSSSDITLSVDADDPDHYTLSGSAESEELRKLLQVNTEYMQKVRALEEQDGISGDVPALAVQEQVRKQYDSLMRMRNHALEELSLKSTSIVSYFAPVYLMPDASFTFLDEVDKRMGGKFPFSKYAQEHHNRVEKLRRTAEGQLAPDIVLADPFGKTMTLSSLRGKYVLVDFWASWCRPCREESPNLVKIYNSFKPYGFDILSVSLDDDRDAWMKAINDDKLLWNHVSDLKKWNSGVVEQYNIEAIPFTVLLNKEGRIIARNLRGQELEKKVDEAIKGGL